MTARDLGGTPAAGGHAHLLIDVGSGAAGGAAGDPPVLLDVRWRLGGPPGIDGYRAGHLPGAAFVDLDADLAGPPGAGGQASASRGRRLPGGDAAPGGPGGSPGRR